MKHTRRLPLALWHARRAEVWQRDNRRCQGPYCRSAPPLALLAAHIDHVVPLVCGGTNHMINLRTLCRRCHVLRAGRAHAGMIANALRDDIIPSDWRRLTWEDS